MKYRFTIEWRGKLPGLAIDTRFKTLFEQIAENESERKTMAELQADLEEITQDKKIDVTYWRSEHDEFEDVLIELFKIVGYYPEDVEKLASLLEEALRAEHEL